MKKLIAVLVAILVLVSAVAVVTVGADYYNKPTKISRISKKTVTVTKGKEFELKVLANGDDDYLRWKITKGKNIVKFADFDKNDDEVEFVAKKVGTAKVKCYIKGTNKSVVFTVKVKKATKTKYISATKARDIALSAAGVKLSNVRDLSVEKENEYVPVVYEVEFEARGYEYNYIINATNGKIRKSFKEFD